MKRYLFRGEWLRLGGALVVAAALAAGTVAGTGCSHHAKAETPAEQEGESEEAEVPVKMVTPRQDKTFAVYEKRPADVLPYFEANLETLVPGRIEMIRTDVGDIVKENDELVRVSVPDLRARAEQQKAAWELSRAQVDQKKAALTVAQTEMRAADSKIKVARARLRSDQAYLEFRKKQARRYAELLAQRGIQEQLVDEQQDRLEGATEAVNADVENVAYAEAHYDASKARIEQAQADLKEAERKVDVAKAEWDYAKAMLDYASIKAPFDGVITRRNVDPGFFVQNASHGRATPLLTIQRRDIVTVVMRVPDNYAPFVSPDTEVFFETPALPGVKVHGKVTRYPPSLTNPEKDRTMIVEVDLWNEDPALYDKKMADPKFTSRLKKGMPGDPREGRPINPVIEGNVKDGKLADGRRMRLMPGMFGNMTLVLRKFENVYMLPSSAVVTLGGYNYLYVIDNAKASPDGKEVLGSAHLVPIKVNVDDGRLAKVTRLGPRGELLGDLTGKEQVIVSNQSSLSEGQPVRAARVEDWKQLMPGQKPRK